MLYYYIIMLFKRTKFLINCIAAIKICSLSSFTMEILLLSHNIAYLFSIYVRI